MSEETRLLDRMMADMERAEERFRPTGFWSTVIPDVARGLREEGFETFRRQGPSVMTYAGTYGHARYHAARARGVSSFKSEDELRMFQEKGAAGLLDGYIEAYADWRVVQAGDRPDRPPDIARASESEIGRPPVHHRFDGRFYSQPFLTYLKMLVFLKRQIDTAPIRRVLELGGGYGALGEILLGSPSGPYFFVNVDLPPIAAVATWYLRRLFGHDAVADYAQTAEMVEIDLDALAQRHRAVVLCPWQLPRLTGRFDLFVNAHSFGEMEPAVVAGYAREIDRLVSPYLLMKNARTGKGRAGRPGEFGTLEAVTRETYLKAFGNFEPVAIDSLIFGSIYGDFHAGRFWESEIMVMRRRG